MVRYGVKSFLYRSKKTAATWRFEDSWMCQSFVTDSKASCVEKPDLKPNWRSDSRLLDERYPETLLCMMRSSTLETSDSSEMGR